MDEYYQHFLSNMAGANSQPMRIPDSINQSPISPTAGSTTFHNFSYLPDFSEISGTGSSKAQKGRRKSASSASGVDAVKHRRTRSGCFTCRSRRVKCDETRPICERCRKGSRDCVYPDPPVTKTSKTKDSAPGATQTTPTSSNGDIDEEKDEEGDVKLATIVDEDEHDEREGLTTTPSTTSGIQASSFRFGNTSDDKSLSPTTMAVAANSGHLATDMAQLADELSGHPNWSHLMPEFQHYLEVFRSKMSSYDYGITNDSDGFFQTTLLNLAVRDEGLLNAVTAFAAYHEVLQEPHGQLSIFLKYYNRSVKILIESLKRTDSYSITTLLTILQLATIEEYLGDWANLMGHQKAAYEIIVKLFNPTTIMQSSIGRMTLQWYVQYDVIVALLGAFPTALPDPWFTTAVRFYQEQIALHPTDVNWKIDELNASMYIIQRDMAHLYSRIAKQQIPENVAVLEHDTITRQLLEWKQSWDPSLVDSRFAVPEEALAGSAMPGDIVDVFTPGILFDNPLLSTTINTAHWHGQMLLHKTQHPLSTPDSIREELASYAYIICQIIASLEAWPKTPSGVLPMMHHNLSMAAYFLPRDARHIAWLGRRFALVESLGYVCSTTRREQVAVLLEQPLFRHWWLPNEEGFTPILKSIRAFAAERNSIRLTEEQELVREVGHLFRKLQP
ncbi:hypothetical protein VHEMI03538 [[Torrubiella] hemipterigena]|uniref:Zn(2)-C6 fungal-type domain-containing protein n=1 Tax=[Torrubiella] hemipterigena TaxID=1531966 RepID=A0A0A1TBG9_9HYPO|nr:hypothetical protein VHEMI03538 [[Torrubiella] hemipterigena]